MSSTLEGEGSLQQLTFIDDQVADFLEEMGSYLEGHLAEVDAKNPGMHYLTRWDRMVILAIKFLREQPTVREFLELGSGNTAQQERTRNSSQSNIKE